MLLLYHYTGTLYKLKCKVSLQIELNYTERGINSISLNYFGQFLLLILCLSFPFHRDIPFLEIRLATLQKFHHILVIYRVFPKKTLTDFKS